MGKCKKYIKIILLVLASIIAIASILSVFRNNEIRYMKMLDFPRIQIFIVSAISLVLVGIMLRKRKWYYNFIFIGLLIGIVINGSYLINYTPIVSTEVPTYSTVENTDQVVSILVANVKMSNKNTTSLLNLISQKKPDLVLAMEIDSYWNKKLEHLENEYPYYQRTINDVAYGMVLYSKFPFEDLDVSYLTNENVPSFESLIKLDNNKNFILHCLHPVPPVYFEDLPDNKGEDEVAMKIIGQKVSNSNYPSIVAGDFNDVVWSHVDEITQTKKLLFDVRVGRGFYNSFSAESLLMKWPLDHVFVTKEFEVKKLERLGKIGSDHYPIYVELVL